MEERLLIDNNIPKSYIRLAVPVVCTMLISMIYNLADTYFVAATGSTDLVAGVSLCAPVLTIQMAFGNIYGQGGCTLTSRLLGADNREAIRRVSAHCIWIGFLVGIALGVFFLIARPVMLPALGADADTSPFASPYYLWLSIGTPFIVVSYVFTNLFRSEGMARQALFASLGVIINIVLDPVFILVLGMGSKGAAIATVIGYISTDVYCVITLRRKSRILSMNPRLVKVPADHLKQILGIGIPAAIMNIVQSISVIFMNHFLLPYGNEKIAAMGIALRASSIIFFVLVGMSYGGQPLFGFFIGSSDKKHLIELTRFNLIAEILVAAVLSVIVIVFAPGIIRIFMDQPEIVADGGLMLRLQAVTMILAGVVLLFTLVFQSAGRIGISFVLSISRQGYIFLAVLFVASRLFGYYGVIAAQAAADVISVVLTCFLFYFCIYRSWKE